ncbi:MAG: metal-sulfur cluster assembly factor [Gammaproteobacteria bacterium]
MNPHPTPDTEAIRSALRLVMDPEVGMNIVDLGLIYKIESQPGALYIEMTMTSPACPMADMILDDIDRILDPMVPPEVDIRVEIVWDPPWSPEKMAPEAREHFGWKR